MLGQVHDGDAVQMVVLMLDAAGEHVIGLQFKPLAVAVLCLDLDVLRALDRAVMSRERQAAFVQLDLLVAQLEDLGVDELNELVLVVRGNLLGQVAAAGAPCGRSGGTTVPAAACDRRAARCNSDISAHGRRWCTCRWCGSRGG